MLGDGGQGGVVSYPYWYPTFLTTCPDTYSYTAQIRVPGERAQLEACRATHTAVPSRGTHPPAPAPALLGKEGLMPENAKREALIKEI